MNENQKEVYVEYRPLKGKVLLKPIVLDEESRKYLPENLRVPEYYAEVVSVGKEVDEVQLHQVVIYPEYGTVPVMIGDELLLIISEVDISLITPHVVRLTEPENQSIH